MPVGARLRIERRFERREAARRGRAASPPARDRGGCAACSPTICTSVWRLPRCQASRTSSSALAAAISTSGSALAGDAHDRAVVEHEAVAVAQRDRLRQVEQEFRAALAGQHDAAAVALAGVEHDAVDRASRASHAPAALDLGSRAASCSLLQNRKYRCAIGSTSAGAQVSSSPSARHLVGFRIDRRCRASRRCGSCSSWRCCRGCSRPRRTASRRRACCASPPSQRRLRDEHHRRRGERLAEGAEHRPVVHRLRRRDRGVGIAHQRRDDRAALDDACRA